MKYVSIGVQSFSIIIFFIYHKFDFDFILFLSNDIDFSLFLLYYFSQTCESSFLLSKRYFTDSHVFLQIGKCCTSNLKQHKYAIYSNATALYLHGLSNRIPIKYDITVKSGYKGSLQKEDNVTLFYTKRELLELGVIDYKLDSGNIIRVYDLDKTICDIIKNKKKVDAEIFNKAIREYFYSKKKNTLKLYEYAKKMNIYNKVRDTFEVFG